MSSIAPARLGALAAALGSLACAHLLHHAYDPGVTAPVQLCEGAPPPTPAVLRGDAGGLVFADFTVEADGSVKDIAPAADQPAPDGALFAATRAWLQQCKFKPALLDGKAIPARTSQGYGFYQPYSIDRAGPAPLDWTDAAAQGLRAPRIERCLPQDPPLLDGLDDSRLSVVVQRDGRAGDVRLAEHLGEEDPGPYPLAISWLRTCHFTPARTRDGAPVVVRVPLPLLFRDGATPLPLDGSLRLADGATLPVPQPTSNCDLHPWPAPQKMAGPAAPPEALAPISVEYQVDTGGSASDVTLLSPARREVFHAVRRYLLGCHFMAVHDETGSAIAVRVKRDFHLRLGARQLQPNGPLQRVVEGDAP